MISQEVEFLQELEKALSCIDVSRPLQDTVQEIAEKYGWTTQNEFLLSPDKERFHLKMNGHKLGLKKCI